MRSGNNPNALDLEELILKFWPQINFRVRSSLGFSNPDWEDTASEILIDIVEAVKKGKFRGESSLGTFIYVITSRRIIDYIRKKGKSSRDFPLQTHIPNPMESMERKERGVILAECVKKLKPRDADMLYLHYYMGLSQKEIAEVFGISKRWVNTRMKNSMQSLRRLLGK